MTFGARDSFFRQAAIIAGLCGPLYFLGLGEPDCAEPMEPIAWKSAREMFARGDWVVPTFNGAVRMQKPPLPMWAAMAVARLRGTDLEVIDLRAPAAAATLLAVLLTLALARDLLGPGPGFAAALFLGTSFGFIYWARVGTWDNWLLAAVTGAFLAFWKWYHATGGRRTAGWFFFVALGLGFLAKGPVVLAFVLPGILTYLARRHDLRALARLPWRAGLLILLAIVLPWPLAVLGRLGWDGTVSVWVAESVTQRLAGNWKWSQLPYYLTALPGLLAPVAFIVVLGTVLPFTRWRRPESARGEIRFLLAWLLGGLVVLSAAALKRPRYAIPLLPAAAILAAALLDRIPTDRRRARWAIGGVALSVAGCWVAAFWLVILKDLLSSGVDLWSRPVAVAAGATVLGATAPFLLFTASGRSATLRRPVGLWLAVHVGALLLLSTVWLAADDEGRGNRWRPLVESVNRAASPADRVYVIATDRLRTKAAFYAYARMLITVHHSTADHPLPERFSGGRTFVFVREADWASIAPDQPWLPIGPPVEVPGGDRWLAVVAPE